MDLYTVRNELAEGRSVFDLPLKATYYARVSTDSSEQLHSLQAQSEYFSSLICANPCWDYVPGYIDEGISGTAVKNRESFLRMMADAKEGLFDLIVTKEVSRFARNTLDSIKYTQQLLSLGVGVLFQSDNINTLLPDSELRLSIMASVAQDEVRKTSERVRFGFRRAIENGVVLGSDRIWGYKKDNGKLIIVEEEAELVWRIFRQYAVEGMGMRAIAESLNDDGFLNSNGKPFGFSTISGILANPKYKGFYCGNKTRKIDYKLDKIKVLPKEEWVMYPHEQAVPAIVSPRLWDKADSLRRSRRERYGAANTGSRYPYSGRIICGEHGTPYYRAVYKYPSGNKEVWQCRVYSRLGRSGCSMPVIYGEKLDKAVGEVMKDCLEDKEGLVSELLDICRQAAADDKGERRRRGLLRETEQLKKRQDRLLDLNIEGRVSDEEFSRRNNELEKRLIGLTEQISHVSERIGSAQRLDENVLRSAMLRYLEFDGGYTLPLVAAFVDRIVVCRDDDGSIHIRIYSPEQEAAAADFFLAVSGGLLERVC